MSKRTDIHRKGAIIPADYSYIMSYSLSTTQEGFPIPSFNVNCIIDQIPYGKLPVGFVHPKHSDDGMCCVVGMRESGKKFAKHGSTGKCTICGAAYIYGDIWVHNLTGEHIHVGHDCADKMEHSINRDAFDSSRTRFANLSMRKIRLENFCEAYPDMAQVFEVADQNSILHDMRNNVATWGSLSAKQIAFAHKLADKIINPPPVEAKPDPLIMPEGKDIFIGRFVSTKESEGPYGYVLKGLFLIEQDGKVGKIWMTVPRGCDEPKEPCMIAVTLNKGDEDGFYFGSRPSFKGLAQSVSV